MDIEVLNETLREVLTNGGVDVSSLDADLLSNVAGVKAAVAAQLKNEPDEWQAHNLGLATEFLANYTPVET